MDTHLHTNTNSHTHTEKHVGSSKNLKDLVLGMSDGLTVPFALAAGLTGAVDSTAIIVTAGVAEIAAGAISMGLGGFLAAKTEADHYHSEEKREMREVELVPHIEAEEVADILRDFGVPEPQVPIVVAGIQSHPKKWVDFMMRFELGLERPDPNRLYISPILIGLAYVFGGLVPLFPYMLIHNVHEALIISVIVTLIALFIFGGTKGYFSGVPVWKAGAQTMGIGGVAAACAFMIAKMIV
jgi:VIT1/CCC1 family predicted Fe2+/Mn2+ transporter